jgi:DNA-binding response OmpR family regulator
MHVLVVDDEGLWRDTARRALRAFAVDGAADAEEALALFDSKTYECVVIDVRLPGKLSGLALVPELRARSPLCAIVLMSGVLAGEIEGWAMELLADGWFAKGQSHPRLARVVENAINAAGSRRPHSARTEHALAVVPPSLHALASAVLEAEAFEETWYAECSYRLALLASAASVHASTGALQHCALAFGIGLESMRQHALVGSRWAPDELRRLLIERRNAKGEHITVSHLYELAGLSGPARQAWVERVLARSLTVNALREELRAHPAFQN